MFQRYGWLWVFFGLLACGQKDFKGQPDAPKAPVAAPTYQSPVVVQDVVEAPKPSPLPPEENLALADCLKQWTQPPHPFGPEAIRQPTVVPLNQSSQNNELLYSDTAVSEKDKLFLINFDILIGNQSSIALKNPKGWYCLNVKAKVINNFKIELGCKTQLAIVSKFAQNDNNFLIQRPGCP